MNSAFLTMDSGGSKTKLALYGIGGDLRVDTLSASGVIPLGAVLAAPRTGSGHHEFDLAQILQIAVFHFRSNVQPWSPW